ncbi:MAG: hypothetical protein QN178_08345 [Armatimonadota bacterium]|nr:hypothetical protein [Armatimonadota bacterium]
MRLVAVIMMACAMAVVGAERVTTSAAPAALRRVAFLIDSWHPISHADVIGTRLLEGYRIGDRRQASPVTIGSVLQVEPRPNSTLRDVATKHNIRIASSVAEALLDNPAAAQPQLAVDGVLIAVRTPLPRGVPAERSAQYRLFMETMAAFDRAGRPVPVFVDKNLAATWEESQAIVAEAARRHVPLAGGSVVPWVPLEPAPPAGRRVQVAVAISAAPYATYAIHAAELLQAFMETRAARETGIASVREVGRGYWSLPDRDRWGGDVMDGLLASARTKRARAPGVPGGLGEETYVVLVQYVDGARGVLALMPRVFDDAEFLLGARYDTGPLYLGGLVLGGAPYDHFGYLADALVQFFTTGRPPAAAERTLLATGMSLFGLRSRESGGHPQSPPSLAVAYTPTPRGPGR